MNLLGGEFMDNVLEFKSVTKVYGEKIALSDFSIEIPKGKIIGLIGPNGAGKSTFIRLAAALIKANKGSVEVLGIEPSAKTKAVVSYLPDKPFLYEWMTVAQSIDYFKEFFQDFDENKMNSLLDFMKIDKKSKVKELSKGMLERLNLSLTLSRNAKLYLLDEPLAAVDPTTRDKIINSIIENFNEESTIIISTHLVREVETLFDEVIFIDKGKLIFYEDAEELRTRKGRPIEDIYKEMFD